MFEPITKKINLKEKVIITIDYDHNAFAWSPREWSNVWNIYTFVHDYKSPDPHKFNDFNSCICAFTGLTNELVDLLNFEEIKRLAQQNGYYLEYIDWSIGNDIVYYIDEKPNENKDRNLLGVALVKKDFEDLTHDRLIALLDDEIGTYNDYANGRVYCFSIESYGKHSNDSLCNIYLPDDIHPDTKEGFEYILNNIGGYDFNPDDFIDYDNKILIDLLKKNLLINDNGE